MLRSGGLPAKRALNQFRCALNFGRKRIKPFVHPLFRQHDRHGGNTCAVGVPNGGRYTGNRIFGISHLKSHSVKIIFTRLLCQHNRVGFSDPGFRRARAGLEGSDPLVIWQVPQQQPARCRPIQRTRVPTSDMTRKCPSPSAMAITTIMSASRAQTCTVSPVFLLRLCISRFASENMSKRER